MTTYMANYKEQNNINGEWRDTQNTQNILFIFADSELDARVKLKIALNKLNRHALSYVKYVPTEEPKEITAISVCHNLVRGTTSVNGIWG